MITKKLLKFREIGNYPLKPIVIDPEASVEAAEETKTSASDSLPSDTPALVTTESVMQEYTCCICLEIMVDPTSLPCGKKIVTVNFYVLMFNHFAYPV